MKTKARRLAADVGRRRPGYDFSRAERGRFFRKNGTARLPIYLDAEVQKRVEGLADRTGREMSELVNHILESELQLIGELEAQKET